LLLQPTKVREPLSKSNHAAKPKVTETKTALRAGVRLKHAASLSE
jgi:hypothetical protein